MVFNIQTDIRTFEKHIKSNKSDLKKGGNENVIKKKLHVFVSNIYETHTDIDRIGY